MANRLSNTPYFIQSGTWRVNEDADTGERYIECVAEGIISRPSLSEYGTWLVSARKAAASTVNFVFCASDRTSLTAATQNGFILYFTATRRIACREIINGVLQGDKFYTAPAYIDAGIDYQLRITRSAGGVFFVYIKGGSFIDWTLVDPSGGAGANPFTDATVTNSIYSVFDLDAGDRLYLDRQYAGVLTP